MADPCETTATGLATQTRRLPGAGRVLVVDDEASIREVIEMLITIEGCEVRTAANGVDAIELLRSWSPDLVLLDLTLPGMDGAEVMHAYHATPGPHAPIILMTGWDLPPARATELGASGVIPKPFDLNDLLDIVAGFVDCTE